MGPGGPAGEGDGREIGKAVAAQLATVVHRYRDSGLVAGGLGADPDGRARACHVQRGPQQPPHRRTDQASVRLHAQQAPRPLEQESDVPVAGPQLGDCGARLSEDGGEPPPPSFRSEGVFAVELLDAAESRRWLYLGPEDGTMELSPVDEVDYDPGRDRIAAERYTLGFERPQINYFSVADGKGHDRGNILDRLKARVAAHVLWGLVSFRRNEDQVSEVVLGYRDGPLRAVRRARLEVEIGWGMPSPLIIADDYFYADHAEGPISITIPFALAYLFGDLDVKIFLDFRDLDGFELLSEGLAGRTIRVGEEGVPTAARTTWFLLRKGGTAFLHRLRLGAGLESVEPTLYYVYDAAADDPPESVRGERPAVGYRLKGWRTVPRGRYEIWMDTYLLDGAAARDPEAAIAVLSRPLRVAVGRASR